MSSATSTSAHKAVPAFREPAEPQAAEGFRPWHFFLLASLVTATVAVMLSRQATPEHLVLISLTIIAAGLAAAGFYRMLSPLAAPDVTMFNEPLSERARAALEREKMLVLRSIKELEFDRSMGKLSTKDFDEMSARLRARAMTLMKQLDEGEGSYRDLIERELRARLVRGPRSAARGPESDTADTSGTAENAATATATGTCAACGTVNDKDAAFCKRCGGKL